MESEKIIQQINLSPFWEEYEIKFINTPKPTRQRTNIHGTWNLSLWKNIMVNLGFSNEPAHGPTHASYSIWMKISRLNMSRI